MKIDKIEILYFHMALYELCIIMNTDVSQINACLLSNRVLLSTKTNVYIISEARYYVEFKAPKYSLELSLCPIVH